jgi:hypothetical protein
MRDYLKVDTPRRAYKEKDGEKNEVPGCRAREGSRPFDKKV